MYRLIILFSLSIMLFGCGPATTRPSSDQTLLEQEQEAYELTETGNFSAAAEKYLQLSKVNRNKEVYFKLKAAEAYVDGGNIEHGQHILDSIDEKKLSDQDKTLKTVIHAWIALYENNPEQAITILADKSTIDLPANTKIKFHEVRALAFEQTLKFQDVINERVLLANFIESADKASENYNLLWSAALELDVDTLNNYRESAPENVKSWIELAIIKKTIKGNINIEAAINTWSQNYPGHPAQNKIIPAIIANSQQIFLIPQKIALLLPRDPALRNASNAIQEGFLAAWYEQETERPILKIYNASEQNILETYKLAVDDGAEFIVGPLEKEAVATLIKNNAITVKTMVLNQYDNNSSIGPDANYSNPLVIQFALSPEDEARHVAERVWFEGLANVLIITPSTSWGERIYNAFQSAWDQLGGRNLEHIRLGADSQEYSTAIEQLLNIDNSLQRSKTLKSKLNRKLYYEPRRRQDADFIFIAANPVIGRQLMPHLRYYRAEDLKVFSISNIYTGYANAQADSDMNNLIFPDMPWIVDPSRKYSSLQTKLNTYRNLENSNYKRLYAFGIDAYNLIAQLGKLASDPGLSYEGETGTIKLDPSGKIRRNLTWVKFVDGIPQPIDTANSN